MAQPWRTDPRLAKARDAALPDVVKARFLFPEVSTWELLAVAIDGVVPEGWTGKLVERPITASDAIAPGERVVLRPILGQANPVRLTDTIRANLATTSVLCAGCGFDVHSEPLGDVWTRQFADRPPEAHTEVWTTRCPACKGTMFVAGPGVTLPVDEIRALSARGRRVALRERDGASPDLARWAAAGLVVLAIALAALAFTLAR